MVARVYYAKCIMDPLVRYSALTINNVFFSSFFFYLALIESNYKPILANLLGEYEIKRHMIKVKKKKQRKWMAFTNFRVKYLFCL